MFIDSSLEFADAEDVNDGTGFSVIGDVKDVRPVGVSDNALADLSAGEPLYVVIEVAENLAGPTSYELRFYTHTASTGVTSGVQMWTTGTVLTADFVVGKRWIFSLPEHEDGYERYLAIAGARTGNAVTTGQINAYITKDVRNWTGTATRVPATDPAN